MNSEANSEIALRYYCAIDQAAGIKPENKLERPAYSQLIGLRHPGAVLHGHLMGGQNEVVIRRPILPYFQQGAPRNPVNSEVNGEMTLHYSCAIERIGWNRWPNELERPTFFQLKCLSFRVARCVLRIGS